MNVRLWAVVAIALVPLLAYPVLSIARAGPRFPTRAECVQAPVEGRPVEVVWGRFDNLAEANGFGDRVLTVGFSGSEVQADGCGRWKVVLDGVPSVAIAQEVASEAERVDLHPTIELDADG